MNKKEMEYVENDENTLKVIKTEILFTPILIIIPLIVGILLINDWYFRDFIKGEFNLYGELVIGLIIIFGNIVFDFFLIKSFKEKNFLKKV